MPMEKPTMAGEGEGREILPRIQWNGKTGKLMRVDRWKDTNGNYVTDQADISTIDKPDGSTVRPAMLMDYASGTNGWVRFQPYDEAVVSLTARMPPRPAGYLDERGQPVMDKYGKPVRHDQMVRVPVYAPSVFGAETAMRELSIKGGNALVAFGDFFDNSIENAPEYLAGKIPLVRWEAARIVDTKGNGVPVFKLMGWHDRPAGFPARVMEDAAPVVPPAPAQRAAAPAMMDDDIPFAPEVR